MEAAGLDLSAHRSQRVTREMLQSAALVLVMEPSHRAALLAMGADPERTHVLSEWPPPGEAERPIADRYGGSLERHVKRVAPHVLETLRARST
jgi:protein-tyrosine-phosphatase